jgi:hypothetical protein
LATRRAFHFSGRLALAIEPSGGHSDETCRAARSHSGRRSAEIDACAPVNRGTDTDSDSTSGAQVDAGIDARSDATSDTGAQVDAGYDADSDTGADADFSADSDTSADADSSPEAGFDSSPDSSSDSTSYAGSKIGIGSEIGLCPKISVGRKLHLHHLACRGGAGPGRTGIWSLAFVEPSIDRQRPRPECHGSGTLNELADQSRRLCAASPAAAASIRWAPIARGRPRFGE